MIFKVAFVCLYFFTGAFVALGGERPVVKIQSSRCDEEVVYKGSGLLFQNTGKTYVLTSDHVLLHGKKGFCQTIWNSELDEQKAVFLVADWGKGLALLEVPGLTPKSSWPSLTQLTEVVPLQNGDPVEVTGFPFGSEKLLKDRNGRVLDLKSQKHLFVELDDLIEIQGAHGEFGMSGAPVFSQDSQFAGVLSHQGLIPGSAKLNGNLLAIPAVAVSAWLKRYFNDPEHFALTFFEDPGTQLIKWDEVHSGEMTFTFSCQLLGGPCTVLISPNHDPRYKHMSRRFADPSGLIAKWDLFFSTHKSESIYVPFFRAPSESSIIGGPLVPVDSLYSFFQYLKIPGIRPMAMLKIIGFGDSSDIENAARAISHATVSLWPGPAPSAGKMGLLQELERATLAFTRGGSFSFSPDRYDWLSTSASELDILLDDPQFKNSWDFLREKNPNQAKTLREQTELFKSQFSRLTI